MLLHSKKRMCGLEIILCTFQVGLTIGVLTDMATDSELVQADHIVSRISEILDHLRAKETN